MSAGAQLGVTPVMLLHFGQLSPLGVVANLLVVPLAGILTIGGVLTLAVAALHEPLAHLLFQSLWLLLVTASRRRPRVRRPAGRRACTCRRRPPWPWSRAGSRSLLGPWARGRMARLGVAALALGAVLATAAGLVPDGLARVIVLDVGQGEAILVRAPDGRALLVDTGGGGPGRGDRGERVVVPVLRRLGLRRLTALALTHGAPDRAGGLAGLLEGMPVDEVWIPAGSEGAVWLTPLAARGIPLRLPCPRRPTVARSHPRDGAPPARRTARDRPATARNPSSSESSGGCSRRSWPAGRGRPPRRLRAGPGCRLARRC